MLKHMTHPGISRLCGLAARGPALTPPRTVSTEQAPPVNVPGIDKPVIVVTGEVRAPKTGRTTTTTCCAARCSSARAPRSNIQAGTVVIGEAGSVGTLIVERGGRLMPSARASSRSSSPAISRSAPETWRLGRPHHQRPRAGQSSRRAGRRRRRHGHRGGTDPNDNSGSLRYVRVEFAGVEFSPDNELNGIAFQGVGRGGSYEYIQVHMNRDDAFEWFGGTADIKHAIASNAADDSFDWTFGWTGRAQFVAIHQRGDDADNGIEADNNEFNNNALPRSNPQLYNFTMCGDPDRNEGGERPRAPLPARHGVHDQQLPDHRLQDDRSQIETTNTATTGQIDNGTTQMGNGVIWNIGDAGGAAGTAIHASIHHT